MIIRSVFPAMWLQGERWLFTRPHFSRLLPPCAIIFTRVQASLLDKAAYLIRHKIPNTHALPPELSNFGTADLIRDRLWDYMNVALPSFQRRLGTFDIGAKSLDNEERIVTHDVAQAFVRPHAGYVHRLQEVSTGQERDAHRLAVDRLSSMAARRAIEFLGEMIEYERSGLVVFLQGFPFVKIDWAGWWSDGQFAHVHPILCRG